MIDIKNFKGGISQLHSKVIVFNNNIEDVEVEYEGGMRAKLVHTYIEPNMGFVAIFDNTPFVEINRSVEKPVYWQRFNKNRQGSTASSEDTPLIKLSDSIWFDHYNINGYKVYFDDEKHFLSYIKEILDIPPETTHTDLHKLDTDTSVFFYEQDFYVLSNFSSFNVVWKGIKFQTAEAAYHWEKFPNIHWLQCAIEHAPSAHEAFSLARENNTLRRPDWDDVKVAIMLEILREKVRQHEYVRRKLLQTGNRELIEDSWRDDFWGWGPNKDGKNMLGKLWMQVRNEIKS